MSGATSSFNQYKETNTQPKTEDQQKVLSSKIYTENVQREDKENNVF